MVEVIFLICLGLVYLLIASIQDIKTTEIPNWLGFSLIIFAIGFRFFFSLFAGDFSLFYQGLIGFGIFFLLGNLFYYSKMFAGGDAKLMIALGPVLPFYATFNSNLKIFVLFLLSFFLVGFFYGIIWSIVLSVKNFNKFKKEFWNQLFKNKLFVYIIMLIGLIFMVLGFFEFYILYFGIFVFLVPILYIYAKAIDESCLVKKIKTKDLREGDWLVSDIKVGKKIIKKDWSGLSLKEIGLIKKCKKEIRIKFGIPYIPVFLISFVLMLLVWFLGNSFWNF